MAVAVISEILHLMLISELSKCETQSEDEAVMKSLAPRTSRPAGLVCSLRYGNAPRICTLSARLGSARENFLSSFREK